MMEEESDLVQNVSYVSRFENWLLRSFQVPDLQIVLFSSSSNDIGSGGRYPHPRERLSRVKGINFHLFT